MVLSAAKRLQVNGYVDNVPVWSKYFKKFPHDVIFPIVWIEEMASIDDTLALQIKARVSNNLTLMTVTEVSAVAIGTVLIVIVALIETLIRTRRRWDDDEYPIVEKRSVEKESTDVIVNDCRT